MSIVRPMLAASISGDVDTYLSSIDYPIWITPKIDGVRAIINEGQIYSRSGKPFRNKHFLDLVNPILDTGFSFDGEVLVCKTFNNSKGVVPNLINDEDCYRRTSSYINSIDGVPEDGFDVVFCIFDTISRNGFNPNAPLENVCRPGIDFADFNIKVFFLANFGTILNPAENNIVECVNQYEKDYLNLGYEGLMINKIDVPYKHGRATIKSGELVKVKRYSDYEAKIIGFTELMINHNEAEKDAYGKTSRSSSMENLEPGNTLGALICEMNGTQFNIGTGFKESERQEIWNNKESYLGKLVKFKSFDIGVKDAPRHPVFIGFRSEDDL